MKVPDFKSVEEVKDFINSTDVSTFGAIHLIDQKGDSIQVPMNEFIEKVGLDKAAEFIFNNQKTMRQVMLTTDEIKELVKKFQENPASLTDEEIAMLHLVNESVKQTNDTYSIFKNAFTLMIKSILDTNDKSNERYSLLLALCLTLLEENFLLSANCDTLFQNHSIYHEIINKTKEQIKLPEVADERYLFLALLDIIGERFLDTDLMQNMQVNYHDFAQATGLNMDFLFGEDFKETEDNAFGIDSKKANEILLEKFRKDDSVDSKEKSKSNVVNLDIRKALKDNKK